jgi:hypothetical protein
MAQKEQGKAGEQPSLQLRFMDFFMHKEYNAHTIQSFAESEIKSLQSQLSQAQEEIKRITPTTQSAEEVVTNAYEAGRKFGNAQKDGTPPYNWPASITEYLEQFKNKSK